MPEVLRAGKQREIISLENEDNSQEKEEKNIGSIQVSYKKYEKMCRIIHRLQKLIAKSKKQDQSLLLTDLQDKFVKAEQMDALRDKYFQIQTQLDYEQQEYAIKHLIEQKQAEIFQLRQENAALVNEIQQKHEQIHQQMWVLESLT